LDALGREMEIMGQAIRELGLRVETIYFGGGTPTSPKDEDFAWMLQKASETILLGQQPTEYTVEGGRPETINRAKLDAMARHGVNRISVNPQTTVQETLMHLGRIHTVEKFYRAFDLARRHPANFIINSDTIIGLPNEGPEEVYHTLNDMKRLAPDNLTVHTLAIKRGSRLHAQQAAAAEALKALSIPEAEALVREARYTARAMGQHPYYLYRQKFMVGSMENVGYSLPGKESLYNIQMMEERQTVIGLGGGATCKWYKPLGGNKGWLLRAPDNPNEPTAYINRVEALAQRKVDDLRLLYDPKPIMV
jgi:oxygen-independent coproporphyrinogen-3 oxidase